MNEKFLQANKQNMKERLVSWRRNRYPFIFCTKMLLKVAFMQREDRTIKGGGMLFWFVTNPKFIVWIFVTQFLNEKEKNKLFFSELGWKKLWISPPSKSQLTKGTNESKTRDTPKCPKSMEFRISSTVQITDHGPPKPPCSSPLKKREAESCSPIESVVGWCVGEDTLWCHFQGL